MKTMLLIAAVLVLPLVWGYLAEKLLGRIWPRKINASAEGTSSSNKDDQQPFPLDYQI